VNKETVKAIKHLKPEMYKPGKISHKNKLQAIFWKFLYKNQFLVTDKTEKKKRKATYFFIVQVINSARLQGIGEHKLYNNSNQLDRVHLPNGMPQVVMY
jgi:hypothetical protein